MTDDKPAPIPDEIKALAAEIEAQLKAAKLLYEPKPKSSTGGLRVHPSHYGVYVSSVNKDGIQKRFNGSEKTWLNAVLPLLYPTATPAGAKAQAKNLLGRESERERLAIGMKGRLLHVQQPMGPGQPGYEPVVLKKGNKEETLAPPKYTAVESLDPDSKRQVPSAARLKQMGPKDHKELPRSATWVQLEPPPPRRYIAMSEFELRVDGSKIRPDEVFISYELDADELEAITRPNPAKFEDLETIKARNLSVHVADLNTELGPERALSHFEDTTKYLIAVLEHLEGTGLEPEGKVRLSACDTYLQSAAVLFGIPLPGRLGAVVARWRQQFGKYGDLLGESSVIRIGFDAERTSDAAMGTKGGWKIGKPDVEVIGRLATKILEQVETLANSKVMPKLQKLFR